MRRVVEHECVCGSHPFVFPGRLGTALIAVDPDDVLLDEAILARLRVVVSNWCRLRIRIAFRLVYEDEYLRRWRANDANAPRSLVLHLRAEDASSLPADYLADGRR